MDIEQFRDYCLDKKAVTESSPFGPEHVVFKVAGKMFALLSLDDDVRSVNLKNAPEKNRELRDTYAFVFPGYHMNKNHWNTVHLAKATSDLLVEEWIDDSYRLVVEGLTKKDKIAFGFL